MTVYEIIITRQAEIDLLELWNYIAAEESFESADYVLDNLEKTVSSLEQMPTKGHVVRELEAIGGLDYLEIHFKPYRIIYSVSGDKVFIYAVINGRRDVQSILLRRLIRPD